MKIYLKKDGKVVSPDVLSESERSEAISLAQDLLAKLAATGEREKKIDELVNLLEKKDEKDPTVSCQYNVDDLIYDHCGMSKKWSNVNNGGYDAQIRALVESIGLEGTEAAINEILAPPDKFDPATCSHQAAVQAEDGNWYCPGCESSISSMEDEV